MAQFLQKYSNQLSRNKTPLLYQWTALPHSHIRHSRASGHTHTLVIPAHRAPSSFFVIPAQAGIHCPAGTSKTLSHTHSLFVIPAHRAPSSNTRHSRIGPRKNYKFLWVISGGNPLPRRDNKNTGGEDRCRCFFCALTQKLVLTLNHLTNHRG